MNKLFDNKDFNNSIPQKCLHYLEVNRGQKIGNIETYRCKDKSECFLNSHFPNNDVKSFYLSANEEFKGKTKTLIGEFEILVSNNASETELRNFIKDNECYALLAGIAREYNVGNHSIYIFPEVNIKNHEFLFRCDYLIVASNSDGHKLIFVEMESVLSRGNSKVFKGKGKKIKPGAVFTDGKQQLKEWDRIMPTAYNSIIEYLKKRTSVGCSSYDGCNIEPCLKQIQDIPNDIKYYDRTKIFYMLVIGSRELFDSNDYVRHLIRSEMENNYYKAINYNRMADNARIFL